MNLWIKVLFTQKLIEHLPPACRYLVNRNVKQQNTIAKKNKEKNLMFDIWLDFMIHSSEPVWLLYHWGT